MQYRGEIKDKLGTLPSRRTKRYMTWTEVQKAAEKLKKKYGERYEISVWPEKELEVNY